MKKYVAPTIFICGFVLTSFLWNPKPDSGSVAVIELFTSQGCSSCPAADKLLSELSKNENIIPLSFHVSYWNYLGWKDPYSSEQFTERQRTYAKKLKLRSIYTPQMIVNGTSEFVGSNRSRAESAVKNAISSQEIRLNAIEQKQNSVVFNYSISGTIENEWLNVALVERHVKNEVPRGENRGRVLEHDNVVRVFKTLEASQSGSVSLTLPGNLNAGNTMVIAYVQKQNTFEITGAAKLAL